MTHCRFSKWFDAGPGSLLQSTTRHFERRGSLNTKWSIAVAIVLAVGVIGCTPKTSDTDAILPAKSPYSDFVIEIPARFAGEFNPDKLPVGLEIGNLAPNIEGEDLDGNKFQLSDYRGKVVMLDFWGDW
jgi:hypothetical protein